MPRITFDASRWLRGASVSDTLPNGGFSPLTSGIDLFRKPGCLVAGRSGNNGSIGNILNDGVIAWTIPADPNFSIGGNGPVAYLLTRDTGGSGRVVTVQGVTSAITMATDSGRAYVRNRSDIVLYNGELFATSTTNLARITGPDYTYWTVTLGLTAFGSGSPHMMCEYEGILYISDGRYLHSYDGSTGTYNVLDLPVGYTITSLCVHQGYLWIAADPYPGTNVSFGLGLDHHGKSSVFLWDGYSPSWLQEHTINERISHMFVNRGMLFVFTRKSFGYWNGGALVDLFALTSPVQKHQVGTIRDRVLFLQGAKIVCYGSPIPGRQRFFSFPLRHPTGESMDALVTGWGDGVSWFEDDESFYTLFPDTENATITFGCTHTEDPVTFRDYVYIRRFVVVLDQAVTSTDSIAISYINSDGDTVTVGTINNTNHPGRREIIFDIENDKPCYFIQPQYTWATNARATGIRYVYVDYEPAEDRPTL